MSFLTKIETLAKKKKATIVLAEAEDIRVIKAASIIEEKKIANIILLGDPIKIRKLYKTTCMIIDPKSVETDFAEKLFELRKHKGLSLIKAKKLVKDPKYFGVMMLKEGLADGMVSGNLSSTADTLRPALQLLKTKEKAFSYFVMIKDSKTYFYADSGFVINPDAKELSHIAIKMAKFASTFIKPKVAMLSYSTLGSADGESAEKSRSATKLAKRTLTKLNIPIEGEIQFDAAIVPSVAKQKGSKMKGKANIFIFPDLASGNIAYKITERLGGFQALGPLILGLEKPVNDLSRGCAVDDIVKVVAMTALKVE